MYIYISFFRNSSLRKPLRRRGVVEENKRKDKKKYYFAT